MLKTRYIKIQVTDLDNDRYFISAFDENERNYAPSTWQYLLFNYHRESFYGTMTENAKIDGTHGVILNGWQLATLFAHDQFNRMIEWDWDDTGQLCLASAHTIYDAVTENGMDARLSLHGSRMNSAGPCLTEFLMNLHLPFGSRKTY